MSINALTNPKWQKPNYNRKPNNKGQKKSRFGRFFQKVSNLIKTGSLSGKAIVPVKNSTSQDKQIQKKLSVPVHSNQTIKVEIPKQHGHKAGKNHGHSGAQKTHGHGGHEQSGNNIEAILELSEADTELKNILEFELPEQIEEMHGHEEHHTDDHHSETHDNTLHHADNHSADGDHTDGHEVEADHSGTEIASHAANIGTATLSTMIGVSQTVNASKQLKQAHAINDYWGKVNSGFDLTCGTLQTLSGVATISAESLSIAAEKTAKATNTVAISRLQNFGKEAGIARFSLLSIKTILNMRHSISFAKGLKNAVGTLDDQGKFSKDQVEKGLNYLVSQLEISPEELKKAEEKCAKKHRPSNGSEIVAQKNSPLLNKQEKAICQQSDGSWNYILAKELINLKKQKQAQFIRAAGKETFEKVSELLHHKENSGVERADWFSNLSSKEIEEAEELFAEIGTSTKDIILKQKGSIGKLAMYAAGITLLILSIVGTGGVLGMVALAGSILIALIYLVQDLQELRELYKEGELTAKDKLLLGLTVGLLTISVTLDIVFPGGTGTLIRSGIMEGLWIMIYGYSYMRNSHNKHKETEHKSISESSSKPSHSTPAPIEMELLPINKKKEITPILATAK